MSDQNGKSLLETTQQDSADIDALAKELNESTGLTWLWAILFGPIYFWVHGFVGMGFVACFTYVLVIINPILAYKCWRTKAEQKAETRILMAKR